MRVEAFVAQTDLFVGAAPTALVVHHGGSGTTLAAAAAGIPELFLPQGADQPPTPTRLARSAPG